MAPRRLSLVCGLSVLLLVLQCMLFVTPWRGETSVNVAVAALDSRSTLGPVPLFHSHSMTARAMLHRLLHTVDAGQTTADFGGSAGTASLEANVWDLQRFEGSAGNTSSHKECGQQTDEFPRNRILIIHEQHLQSMGCDVRLLRFVKDLLYLNQEVSMMFRGSTPVKMRQPKSKQLAAILHIDSFEEEQLRKGLRQPPGLYEWTSAERFAQLMAMGYFNVVIIFLWFWYDPQPSVAELVLPLIRSHSPPDKQPFVTLLSDDAHSIRCTHTLRSTRFSFC